MKQVIVDTGPLVAFFDRDSQFHEWTVEQFRQLSGPLYSCQAVVTETLFLLKRGGISGDLVLQMIQRDELLCALDLRAEIDPIRKLLRKYRDLPASLADVCLVRMSELGSDAAVFTLDRHFSVYRRHGRRVIPLLSPFRES